MTRPRIARADAAVALKRAPARGVAVFDLDAMPWTPLGRPGIREKRVRTEAASGLTLGLVAFEPFARSGLHRHLAPAISYFLAGSLTDYQGTAGQGMAGINLAGATHDAFTYTGVTIASRLDGPVEVPEGAAAAHPLAGGSARVVNPNAERWPDINIAVEALPLVPSGFPRLGRRAVFDYAGTGLDRRFVQLTLMPEMPRLVVTHSALADWFVIAGDVTVGGRKAYANSFVTLDAGAEVTIASEYGAAILCWADGPAGDGRSELYGF
jgi:hypothetical protein